MTSRSKTVRALGCAVVGVLGVGACASSSGATRPAKKAPPTTASSATTTSIPADSFPVTFQIAAPPTSVLAPSCDADGRCVLPYSNLTSQLTGDVTGTGVGAGSAFIGKEEASSVAHAVVTATIGRCGSGTFVTRYFVVYDLRDVSAGKPGIWEVVPGLGTGDLAALAGSGTFTITKANPDMSNVSKWVGKLSCRF